MIKLKNLFFLDTFFGTRLVTICYWIMIMFTFIDHINLLRALSDWRVELPSIIFRFFYSLFYTRLAAEVLASFFKLNSNVQALVTSTGKVPQDVKSLS